MPATNNNGVVNFSLTSTHKNSKCGIRGLKAVRGIIADEPKIETGKRRVAQPKQSFSSLIYGLSVEFLHPTLWSIES
jgi:hypothetical protein